MNDTTEEASEQIRKRVEKARNVQRERYHMISADCNSELSGKEIAQFCVLTEAAQKCMEHAFNELSFSARGYYRVLKTARTIADLSGSEKIEEAHVLEALLYRQPEQRFWEVC